MTKGARCPVIISVGSFLTLILSGCSTPTGQIYLDRPEVFTRERLINRRLADLQWLEDEMKRPIATTLQGAREQREFSGLTVQLEAQFDPLAGRGAATGAQVLQSTQQVAILQNEIVRTALQQKLKDLQDGNLNYAAVLGTNSVAVAPAPGSSFTATQSAVTLPSVIVASNLLPTLPSASNITITSDRIQLTAPEQFRDRLAYRDTVAAAMREKELDDTHDRAGMTLYTLKFDLSVIPGENNRNLGRAEVTVAPPAKQAVSLEDYKEWLRSLRRNFDREVISIQRRYLRDFLTDEEERKLIIASWRESEKLEQRQALLSRELDVPKDLDLLIWQSEVKSWLEARPELKDKTDELTQNKVALRQYRTLREHLQSRKQGDAEGLDREDVLTALSQTVADTFETALNDDTHGKLAYFDGPKRASSEKDDFLFLIPVKDLGEAGRAALERRVSEVESNAKQFVYTVDPKESAQNLSDVSARDTVRNFALALAAAFPQAGTKASGYVNYVKRNQYLLETIKRKPSLVGFIESANSFGWIVGPRFKISEDLKLDYEHTPVQHSVQATIAVPAWWSSVEITTTNQWLDDKAAAAPSYSPATSGKYEVRLRPDVDALTRALLERSAPTLFSTPQIHPRWDPDAKKRGYVVQAQKPAQLLILGRNLWRNPQIFIGSQGTRKYEVLPNMEGLVAMFDEVQPIQTLSTSDEQASQVDLRVVTSDGESVLKNAVSVLSGRRPNQKGSFVTAIEPWAVAGTNLVLAVDMSLAPKNYARYDFALAQKGEKPKAVDQATPVAPQSGRLTVSMPKKEAPWTTPSRAVMDVWLKLSPDSQPYSVLEGGEQSLVVFSELVQSQFRLESTSATISTNPVVADGAVSLKVLLPELNDKELFWEARPGLQAALQSNSATLRLATGSQATLIGSAPFQNGGFQFKLNPTNVIDQLELKDGKQVNCVATILLLPDQVPPRWQVPAGGISLTRKDR